MKKQYSIASITIFVISLAFSLFGMPNFAAATSCPLAHQQGRVLVIFRTGVIVSNNWESAATLDRVSTNIARGSYDITLVSYDEHTNSTDQGEQQESWYVVFRDRNSNTIATSPAISDLPQSQNFLTETVARSYPIPETVTSVSAFHAVYPSSNANSVRPVCAAFDAVGTFSSSSGQSTITQSPLVITYGASDISQSNATLNGYVDPYGNTNTTRWFEWGLTNAFGNTTAVQYHGINPGYFAHAITGLSSNTTYYYRAVAQNAYGLQRGVVTNFQTGITNTTVTTTNVVNVTPLAFTKPATQITTNHAQLNGTIIAGTNMTIDTWFEWGAGIASLNNQTVRRAGYTSPSLEVNEGLFGLAQDTTYYYRLAASTSNGVIRGQTLSFRTSTPVVATSASQVAVASRPVTAPPPTPSPVPQHQRIRIIKNVEGDTFTGCTADTCATVRSEGQLAYLMYIKNEGTERVRNMIIKEVISPLVDFVDAPDGGVYDAFNHEIVWRIEELKAQETISMRVELKAKKVTEDTIIEIATLAEADNVDTTTHRMQVKIALYGDTATSAAGTTTATNTASVVSGYLFGGGILTNVLLGGIGVLLATIAFLQLSTRRSLRHAATARSANTITSERL